MKLSRISNSYEKKFYEIEAMKNSWSLRELERRFDSVLYARLSLSRDKDKVLELLTKREDYRKTKGFDKGFLYT